MDFSKGKCYNGKSILHCEKEYAIMENNKQSNDEVVSALEIKGIDLLRFFQEKSDNIRNKVGAGFRFDRPDVAEELSEKRIIQSDITDRKIYIEFIENIDVKNVIKEDRCYIHLENNDGSFVDIPYRDYRKKVINEEEHIYMEEIINRLFGVISVEENKEFTKSVCEYIAKYSTNLYNYIKKFEEIGWDIYYGKNIFKYDRIYPDNLSGVFDSRCCHEEAYAFYPADITDSIVNEFKTVGAGYGTDNILEYQLKELLANVMNSTIENRIIISAAFTGVFRKWLNDKDNNININVWGESASGKTTITRYAISLFGNPEELEGSFSDGEEAVEVLRANRVFLPYVVDDRLLRSIDKSEQAQAKELLLSIFREYDSRVKERAGGKNAQFSGKRIYGPILSSSVKGIFGMIGKLNNLKDLGQYRRLIELEFTRDKAFATENWDKTGTVSKQDFLDDIKTATNSAYGHTFKMFIQDLTSKYIEPGKLIEDVKYKYDENRSIVRDVITQISKDTENDYISSVDRFALILTSYDYLSDFLYEFGSEDDKEEALVYDKMKIIELLMSNLIEKMNQKAKDTNEVIEVNTIVNETTVAIKTVPIVKPEDYLTKILIFFKTYKKYFKTKEVERHLTKEEFYKELGWYEEYDNTLTLYFRPHMSIELMMIYAEEILKKPLTEKEINDYIKCSAENKYVKEINKVIPGFVQGVLGITEKTYDDKLEKIKEEFKKANLFEYKEIARKFVKDGAGETVFIIKNYKAYLQNIDTAENQGTEEV